MNLRNLRKFINEFCLKIERFNYLKLNSIMILYIKMFMPKSNNPDLENCGKLWSREENTSVLKLINENKYIKLLELRPSKQ